MTPKQKLVLDFITVYIKVKGFAPSMQNIADGLELKSRSNIHRIIHELEALGVLNMKANGVRTLKPVDKTVDFVSRL